MLDIFMNNVVEQGLTVNNIIICMIASISLGIGVGFVYMFKNRYNKNFVVTVALLPTIVQIVIMMVGGNIGTGIAVAGAFSLIRFRSVTGSARDIGTIFFAVAIGLATAMGYIFLAAMFFVIVGAVNIALLLSPFGNESSQAKLLKITIPESLDYEGLLDDLFIKYTDAAELERVRTISMGSLFELSYAIKLKGSEVPKSFIDEMRCRNGNLNITISRWQSVGNDTL